MAGADPTYRLYYWAALPGRGEFVRLVFEQAGVPYVDVGRLPEADGGGSRAVVAQMRSAEPAPAPLAPPILVHGDVRIGQTANICDYVAGRHGLAPTEPGPRAQALSLALTLADLVAEAHDTHHPVGAGAYYEDQKTEALRHTAQFVSSRMPKFLRYFEGVLQANPVGQGRHLMGSGLTYVDLMADQVLRGLAFAFPRAFAAHAPQIPGLVALRDHVDALPAIAAYRASDRYLDFNDDGIFRAYPELDLAPDSN